MAQRKHLKDIDLDLVEAEAAESGRHWKEVLREKLSLLHSTDGGLEAEIRDLRKRTAYFRTGDKVLRDELYDR